jgi:hypothetical protein
VFAIQLSYCTKKCTRSELRVHCTSDWRAVRANGERDVLFAATDAEDLGAAHWALAADRRLPILHGDILRVLNFPFRLAFYAIRLSH